MALDKECLGNNQMGINVYHILTEEFPAVTESLFETYPLFLLRLPRWLSTCCQRHLDDTYKRQETLRSIVEKLAY